MKNKHRIKFQHILLSLLIVFSIFTLNGCGNNPHRSGHETENVKTTEQSKTEMTATSVSRKDAITTEAASIETATSNNASAGDAEQDNPRKDILIAIDPGHQSENVDMSDTEPNAPGSSEMKTKATGGTYGRFSGVPEYQLNLDISLALRDALKEKGYRIIMTREDNETAISNSERAQLANEAGADISIRIHANGCDDSSVNGALALIGSSSNPYVGELYEDSSHLAESVLDEYCKATGMVNQGVTTSDTMTGINWSTIPVMILEMGYMTNESNDTNMQDTDFQKKMVDGIVNGIERYYAFPDTGDSGSSDKKTSATLSDNSRKIKYEASALLEDLRENGMLCSAYMKNQKTGETINLSSGKQKAASIIKLFVAGAIYQNMDELIEQGNSENEIEELVKLMITVSDNDACNTLVRMLGDSDADEGMYIVNSYISSLGYKNTSMGRLMLDFESDSENYVDAAEVGDYLERLYEDSSKTGVSKITGASKIISYMKQQEYTEKIPSVLPSDVVVANKTGDLTDTENDAAIVYSQECDYIICVFVDEVNDLSRSNEAIKDISSLTYKYWN
jgi:N-acetylmuramoyl-L-alanine amidase